MSNDAFNAMLTHRKHSIGPLPPSIGAPPSALALPMRRQPWIEVCAERLAELSPALTGATCAVLAAELWADVGGYDPVIAAELEHEADIFDD